MPYLIVCLGGEEIKRLPLDRAITVGRAKEAHVRTHDSAMSRNHCLIEKIGDDFLVRDLNSRNGTILNGRQIKEEKLQHGDILHIGRTSIRFLTTAFEPAPARSPIARDRPDEPGAPGGASDTSLDLSSTRLPTPQPKK